MKKQTFILGLLLSFLIMNLFICMHANTVFCEVPDWAEWSDDFEDADFDGWTIPFPYNQEPWIRIENDTVQDGDHAVRIWTNTGDYTPFMVWEQDAVNYTQFYITFQFNLGNTPINQLLYSSEIGNYTGDPYWGFTSSQLRVSVDNNGGTIYWAVNDIATEYTLTEDVWYEVTMFFSSSEPARRVWVNEQLIWESLSATGGVFDWGFQVYQTQTPATDWIFLDEMYVYIEEPEAPETPGESIAGNIQLAAAIMISFFILVFIIHIFYMIESGDTENFFDILMGYVVAAIIIVMLATVMLTIGG